MSDIRCTVCARPMDIAHYCDVCSSPKAFTLGRVAALEEAALLVDENASTCDGEPICIGRHHDEGCIERRHAMEEVAAKIRSLPAGSQR